jgi:hypothetical protein
VGNETIADTTNGPASNTLLGYMMATATAATTGQTPTTNIPYLTQVFSSSNHFVLLFKVSYASGTVVKVSPIHGPINYGQKVLIAGNLTDANGNLLSGPLAVDIEDSIDNGATFNKVQTIPVNPDGSFNYTWIPDAGSHIVRVHYLGRADVYLESTSDQALQVNKANVELTLKASTTNPSLGQDVLLTWNMSPPVTGANITLSYTSDNSTFVKIKSFIMTSSSMNYTWKVAARGTFQIVVTFAGNDNYNTATASIIMKSV